MDLKKLVIKYLTDVKNMQLATVADGNPWICTVFFVADDECNLYWTSGRSRQHSREITQSPQTAVTVVKDRERKQALQIAGKAYEVDDADLERVHKLYMSKFGPKDYDLEEMQKHDPEGRAYWTFKPTKMFFWDEVNFPENPKQEYSLNQS